MRRWLTGAALIAALFPAAALAQSPVGFAVEARGAFALPTGEWNDEDVVGSGYGFGANVQADFGAVAAYAGWERFTFGLDDADLEGVEANAHDTGFRAGLIAGLPVGGALPVAPFALAGLLFNRTDLEFGDDSGSLDFQSDDALGFELGAGAEVALGPSVAFTPAIRYRRHGAEFDAFSAFGEAETTVAYFLVDVGLRVRLGR